MEQIDLFEDEEEQTKTNELAAELLRQELRQNDSKAVSFLSELTEELRIGCDQDPQQGMLSKAPVPVFLQKMR